jgi:hypothetical protein
MRALAGRFYGASGRFTGISKRPKTSELPRAVLYYVLLAR